MGSLYATVRRALTVCALILLAGFWSSTASAVPFSTSFGPTVTTQNGTNVTVPSLSFNVAVPTGITGNATLDLTIEGDLDDPNDEHVNITIDGVQIANFNQSQCNTVVSRTITLTQAQLAPLIADGQLNIVFTAGTTAAANPSQNFCVGVAPFGAFTNFSMGVTGSLSFEAGSPSLAVTKSHVATFTQGSIASWRVQVANNGTAPTNGSTVTVVDTLPSGYTLASFNGAGWSCTGTTTVTCTTNAVVAASAVFNLLNLTVSIPANSPTSVNNTAAAYGGGDPTHTSLGTAVISNNDATTVVQTPASIVVNGGNNQSTAITTNFATALSVLVRDAANVPIPNASVGFTAPFSGASGRFSNLSNVIVVATNASGIASAVLTANSIAGGPYPVVAQSGSVSTSFAETNLVGPPASVVGSGGGQSTAILTAFTTVLSVTVRDAGNNFIPNTSVTFTAPASGASAVFSNATNTITVTTNASGAATAAVSANSIAGGPYSVTAQAGSASTGFALTNLPGAPASVSINAGNNQSATILTGFTTPLSVTVRDAGSNLVPNTTVTFTAPGSGASAVMPNSTNTIAVTTDGLGVASIPVSANATAGGPYSVTAQAGSASTAFSLTNLVGAPASIAVNAGDNQSTAILTAFATPLSVVVRDAGNNLVPGANVTFTGPPSGASGEFSNLTDTITVATDSSGIATAPISANATAGGPYLVVAQVGTFSVPFSLTNLVGAPASVSINSGDNQSTTILTNFAPLSVTVRDAGLNPIPNTTVTFTAPGSGASGTFPNSMTSFAVSTDASGVAYTPFLANATAGGPYVVAAQAGSSSASFNLTNLVGAPAVIAVNGGDNQSATILTAFATPLSVVVTDAGNNLVPGANVTFSAPPSGASGEFSNLTNTITVATNSSGIATAPISANATAGGPYLVVAQVGALSAPFSLTNLVGAPASMSINSGDNQSTTILTNFAPLSVTVRDAGLNPIPNTTVTFTAPGSGASGTFPNSLTTFAVSTDASGVAFTPFLANATAGGPYVVGAQAGATSASFNLTNLVGAPASLTLNGGDSQSTTILTAFAAPLSVIVRDAGNNLVPNANVTFTAPPSGAGAVFSNSTNTVTIATNASGLASAPVSANAAAGSYTAAAQVGSLLVPFALTNTVGAPATIAVNGGNNQSPVIFTAFATPMSVLVRDVGNNPVSGASVTFTAPGSGPSGAFPVNALLVATTTDSSGIATATTFTANGTAGGPYAVAAQVGAHTTSFSLTNTQGATATTIASSASSVLMGEPVTLTAHVTPTAAPGTVTFSDGSTPICTNAPLSAGTATCNASFSTSGTHSISAHYNGSVNYSPSTSPTIAIAVTDQRIKTVEVIGKFLSLRDDMLLAHAPDGQRQIDRLMRLSDDGNGTGFAEGGTSIPATAGFAAGGDGNLVTAAYADRTGSGRAQSTVLEQMFERTGLNAWREDETPTGFYPQLGSLTGSNNERGANVSFSTSLDEIMRYSARFDDSKLGANGATDKLPGIGTGVDVWLQGSYASFDDDRRSDATGHFGVVYLGADWVPRPWLLVGALVQYDDAQQKSSAASYEIEGSGWMAGPYATVRLSHSLFWQSRAAWGTSSNSVSPFMTYTDNFDTTRWLISSSLTGNWASGRWRFRPTASFSYIEDEAESYLDHFGVLIPSVTTSLGQLKAEPEVIYVYKLAGGTILEPRVTASLIWNFDGSDTGAAFGGSLIGPEELRGKLEAGFGIRLLSGVTLDVSGSYDGIGSDDYNATAINLGARIPIN